MLTKNQIEKYADVMIWGLKTARKRKFKKGSTIAVRYEIPAVLLAEAIFSRLVEEGFNVTPRASMTENMQLSFFSLASNSQLKFIDPWMPIYCDTIDGSMMLFAPQSLTHLKDVDPKRMSMCAIANKKLRKIQDARENIGMFGWTLCTYPTEEPAKQAGLTLKQYTNQIVKACYLDEADPVAKWNDLYHEAMDIKKRLNSLNVKYFRVESKNMDIKIYSGEKRQWLGVSGHNIPSFEIFMSPDFHHTEGKFFADIPSFVNGNYVKGIELEFKRGKIVSAKAEENDEFLNEYIKTDNGARQIGEFALVDKRFSKIDKFMADTLFDENFGGKYGSMHVALGNSYLDTYTGNQAKLSEEDKKKLGFNASAIHWDIINSEDKVVTAHLTNGKTTVIYENGVFF
jgi:aminopeptidase